MGAGFHYAQERIGDSDGHALGGPVPEEPDGPLALATFDEISAELSRRYEGTVVIVTSTRDGQTDTILVRRGGGCALAVGLCEYAKKWVLDNSE